MTAAPAFDDDFLDEPPPQVSGDSGASYARRAALAVGPLRKDGFPAVGVGLSCDPGTGGGQCPRVVVQGRQRGGQAAPSGWDAGAKAREADAAWWRTMGEKLGGEPVPELDVDAALPGRGTWGGEES